MTATLVSAQPWTAAKIDTALVHINTALARHKRRPDGPVDNTTMQAIEEARELQRYLEDNPSACTPDGRACCGKLLEVEPR